MAYTSQFQAGTPGLVPLLRQTGFLQGDPLSPLLFNIYLHDLPDSLSGQGANFEGRQVQYIMCADDLCLLSNSAKDLQLLLDELAANCSENDLTVNTVKTKCLVFHRGRLPEFKISFGDEDLELVNEFAYLGVKFSSQISFSTHLKQIAARAKSKIGFLFPRLKLDLLPLWLVLKVF